MQNSRHYPVFLQNPTGSESTVVPPVSLRHRYHPFWPGNTLIRRSIRPGVADISLRFGNSALKRIFRAPEGEHNWREPDNLPIPYCPPASISTRNPGAGSKVIAKTTPLPESACPNLAPLPRGLRLKPD